MGSALRHFQVHQMRLDRRGVFPMANNWASAPRIRRVSVADRAATRTLQQDTCAASPTQIGPIPASLSSSFCRFAGALAVAGVLTFAGCGDGGGGSAPVSLPGGTPLNGNTPPPKATSSGNVSFSFAIPRGKSKTSSRSKSSSGRRRPSFISPGFETVFISSNALISSARPRKASELYKRSSCPARPPRRVISFNDVIASGGFNLMNVRLMRHQESGSRRGRTVYELLRGTSMKGREIHTGPFAFSNDEIHSASSVLPRPPSPNVLPPVRSFSPACNICGCRFSASGPQVPTAS